MREWEQWKPLERDHERAKGREKKIYNINEMREEKIEVAVSEKERRGKATEQGAERRKVRLVDKVM